MPRSLRRLLTAALLTAVPAVHAAEAMRGQFTGVVYVGEDGGLRVEALGGVEGALAVAVRSQLEALRATPAVRGGRAVAGTAPVSGTVELSPSGDQYQVGLRAVSLQPGATHRAAPLYPVDAIRNDRAGWVELEFGLDDAGVPADVRTVFATDVGFDRAATRALAEWRFATAGTAPGRRYRLAVSFRTDTKQPATVFQCPADAAYARLDTQPACLDEVSVHGSRVRR